MITGQQLIGIILGCLFAGVAAGMLIWYLVGTPRCEHKWEKIIDDKSAAGPGHVVVHMCSKCGKIKRTKVNI